MPHFVKKFDINGVKTKQVACIELHGKPNAATKGAVGVLGIDVDSPAHELYKCVAVNGSLYTWELCASGGGGGGGGVGITRANYSGSGNVTIEVQDQYVYYVTGYSNITVVLPDSEFSAYFFVSFPDDALSCSFNLPNGFPAFGNNLAECDFGENWEISIDSVGGALALRKRGR